MARTEMYLLTGSTPKFNLKKNSQVPGQASTITASSSHTCQTQFSVLFQQNHPASWCSLDTEARGVATAASGLGAFCRPLSSPKQNQELSCPALYLTLSRSLMGQPHSPLPGRAPRHNQAPDKKPSPGRKDPGSSLTHQLRKGQAPLWAVLTETSALAPAFVKR